MDSARQVPPTALLLRVTIEGRAHTKLQAWGGCRPVSSVAVVGRECTQGWKGGQGQGCGQHSHVIRRLPLTPLQVATARVHVMI